MTARAPGGEAVNPEKRFSLANLSHLSIVVGLMVATGGMCAKCGHGTRVTSKNWARCKKCGEKVRRHKLAPLPSPEARERHG